MLKKSWQRIILFFFLLAAAAFLAAAIHSYAAFHYEETVPDKLKNLVGVQREEPDTLDLIILGDSISYTSISPMELWSGFGVTSYDCGQAGLLMQEAYETAKKMFRTQKPKVVLLETSLLFGGQSGIEGWTDRFNVWVEYHCDLFLFHDLWKSVLFGEKYTRTDFKGYSFRRDVYPYSGEDYLMETDETAYFGQFAEKYLRKLKGLCDQNQAELVLFSSISPMQYDYSRIALLQETADQYGLNYIDLNTRSCEVGINWKTDSLDYGDHLNINGAEKVTAYMGQYLTREFALPDHRNEERYAHWAQMLEEYEDKKKLK